MLGLARLRYTMQTGAITSKTAAAGHALQVSPASHHRILEEALRLRRADGPPRSRSRPARARDAAAYMRAAATDLT
ncbi:aminoglycoside adenylyltransferase domain-containing protein [Dactylosporangium salmoneum]|uniref:Adenylyltransferase AadA C-terminal domain-containing protein n=1 Tax=Dactylosporangium salmoneum TaxID=53361 RepID=A0ABP5UIL4_9ACTN